MPITSTITRQAGDTHECPLCGPIPVACTIGGWGEHHFACDSPVRPLDCHACGTQLRAIPGDGRRWCPQGCVRG